jgi:nucleoside-diphosphate-sugar epimerase/pimeloyl-ACP methyl ester carboxylesterase
MINPRGESGDALNNSSILVTGGTGFLGSHLLLRLMQRHSRILAIVRGESPAAVKARLIAKMDEAASSIFQAPDRALWSRVLEVYAGDVTRRDLGLTPEDCESVRERTVTALWHFAGSLKYEEKHRSEIFLHNVEGTRNALEFAVKLGIPGFVYVSTAFAAGCATGTVPEALTAPGIPFNNAYEESKAKAEQVVMSYGAERALNVRILRPGIVVGPSTTLRTGGSDSGLYGFIAILNRTKQALSGLDHAPILIGDPATPAHFSPVDHFVDDALHLIDTNFAGGPIYHTLCETTLVAGSITLAFAAEIGIPCFDLKPAYERDASPIELMLDRLMGMYGVACRYPKRFVRSLPHQPPITVPQFHGYVRECLSEIRRKKVAIPWDRGAVRSFDGTKLTSYSLNDSPQKQNNSAIVLVNAFGMDVDIWETLVYRLRSSYRVVTWDSRGVPGLTEPFDEARCDVTSHARDLNAVLDHHEIQGAHFVGWCTGAQVALRFASLFPSKVLSFVSVNGAFSFSEDIRISEFKKNIMYLMPKIAASRAHASAYHQALYGNKTPLRQADREIQAAVDLDRSTVHEALLASRELMVNMTSAPFRTEESLYRYAHLGMHLVREPSHAWAEYLTQPALILTGAHDTVALSDESEELARRIPKATFVKAPTGDHFSVYHSAAYVEHITAFVADVDRVRANAVDDRTTDKVLDAEF